MAIADGYVTNFETLKQATLNNDVALLECVDAKTGKLVITVCAVDFEPNGEALFIPLAKMFDGDPYEELIPPA